MFLGVTAFFVVIGVIYWFASYEEAGAVMLAAQRHHGARCRRARSGSCPATPRSGPRIATTPRSPTGAGPVDVFPLHSVWPFAVGLSAALFASGFAFGLWLVLIGGGALAISLIGYVREVRNETLPSERAEQA